MGNGETLTSNECINSSFPAASSSYYQLTMQNDGNLVLSYGPNGTEVWNSGTSGNAGAYAEVTTNGLFAIFARGSTVTSTPIWSASGTDNNPNDALFVNSNGTATIQKQGKVKTIILWSTSTAQNNMLDAGQTLASNEQLETSNSQYVLTMQDDGNLVLYDEDLLNPFNGTNATAIWESNTANNPGAYVTMQTDGNLVVYSATGTALWWSGGTTGNVLVLQTDGNLVIYDATSSTNYTAEWSTGTNNPPALAVGQTLGSGGMLVSPSGTFQLYMQTDGNLVLYATAYVGLPLWQSDTPMYPKSTLYLTPGGDLEVLSSSNAVVWSSNTSGAVLLAVQNDANVVLYGNGSTRSAPEAIWATNTGTEGSTLGSGQNLGSGKVLRSPNGNVTVVMQGDGNLVAEFRLNGNTVYWQTGTAGDDDSYLSMQADGNLVVYSQSGTALWQSGTAGNPGADAVVQNDGNFVVYGTSGTALWSSGAGAASGSNVGSEISVGQSLNGGQYMQSPNGQYTLYNSSNVITGGTPGKLILYVNVASTGLACEMEGWGNLGAIQGANQYTFEDTYARDSYLTITASGNLSYNYPPSVIGGSGSNVSWSPNVSGGEALVLQNDGNLVLYGAPPSGSASAPPIWQSETNTFRGSQLCTGESLQRGQYLQTTAATSTSGSFTLRLTMQSGGNLVLYNVTNGAHTAYWATSTAGSDYAVQQTDGNFVIYRGSIAIWSTGSHQTTSSNDWSFVVGNDTKDSGKATKDWGLQVYNTSSGDYAWYADSGHPTGTHLDPPQTSQITHGVQAVLNLTTFILTA